MLLSALSYDAVYARTFYLQGFIEHRKKIKTVTVTEQF